VRLHAFIPCVITCLLVADCTPAPSAQTPSGWLDTATPNRSPSSAPDAGAPIACMYDVKDLTPCNADCDRGIVFACTVVATRIERGEGASRDLPRAVILHERACELRDAASCVSAARMHASGSGVPPSRARQIELLGTACKLGDATACAVPAKAFANGSGVARDEKRARDLWQLACAAGVASACEELEKTP
jgi:TPR repeat protein